jgi:putative protease
MDIGLWAVRLMFTTESARECVLTARSYKGEGDFRATNITRGLYYRGVR